jgi:nitrile hydratase
MNGVHDMGGMHGFGPIEREVDEPIFHAEWEARVLAIGRLLREGGYQTIDAHRHGIESIPPAEYLRQSYYERWLTSLESILDRQGFVTDVELEERVELLSANPAATFDVLTPGSAPAPISTPPSPPPPAPRFAVGDAVVTRNVHPAGHTRLPRYARGKRGVVIRLNGAHILPDTNAHGLGECPEPLYSVRFDTRELWGDAAEPRQTVTLDLWDSYLEGDG